jgi:flagellar hook-associated protein 3 FlgL
MARAIESQTARVGEATAAVSTGRKATRLEDLGGDAARTFSARTALAREATYEAASQRTASTLAQQDTVLEALHDAGQSLHNLILKAVGTGRGEGLRTELQLAFGQAWQTLNARDAGRPMFSGTQPNDPFTVKSLDDLAALDDVRDAFANDGGRAHVRLADSQGMTYGLHADEIGSRIVEAMHLLAKTDLPAGAIDGATVQRLTEAAGLLGDGLTQLREVQGANGRRQEVADRMKSEAVERRNLLEHTIGDLEDADVTAAAVELATARTALETSYAVFAQLRNLSLVNYLK